MRYWVSAFSSFKDKVTYDETVRQSMAAHVVLCAHGVEGTFPLTSR